MPVWVLKLQILKMQIFKNLSFCLQNWWWGSDWWQGSDTDFEHLKINTQRSKYLETLLIYKIQNKYLIYKIYSLNTIN